MTFLRNAWYVAAWADEVGDQLVARKLLGESIVLWRDQDGVPSALFDRCPHRMAPLSLGKHRGNLIECGYHGLRFDATGACVFNPHGKGTIPRGAAVRSYPLVERYSLLWIWMGDEGAADESLIPEFDFLSDAAFHNVKGYTLAEGHYELMTDNIMDLGHIEFLHAGLLGTESVRDATSALIQVGATVHCNRRTHDETLPPFLQLWYEAGERKVDRWLNVRWDPAATMKLAIGVQAPGDKTPRESQGCHLMTPADLTTTHYFWALGRDWGGPNEEWDKKRLASLKEAFDTQDKPMIEAVQRNMGTHDLDSLHPVMLSTDGGPVRARRVLAKLIAEEQALAPK